MNLMKRALLVGINSYRNFGDLAGCVNDVKAIAPLLERNENGDVNFECQTVVTGGGAPTSDSIRQALTRLLAPGADVSLFYFAGHGMTRANDVVLVSEDGTHASPGVAFSEVLSLIQPSPVREVVVILDCCFSGAAGEIPQLSSAASALRHGVSILTASRGDQTAAESASRGMFSTYLCGGLEGGAADVLGKVNLAGLYAYLTECFGSWEQRPVFKANVDRLHDVRRCYPSVPLDKLRELRQLFPSSEHEYPLDPSFEPDEPPAHAEHERIFAILQQCRAAKLIEPVGTDHMYYAAIRSLACRLTPLGRLYWHMADTNRL